MAELQIQAMYYVSMEFIIKNMIILEMVICATLILQFTALYQKKIKRFMLLIIQSYKQIIKEEYTR